MQRLFVLVACLLCTSCATTTGAIVGAVTTPVGFWRHTHGVPTWGKILLVPFAAPLGPFVGFTEGLRCDVGWLQNLEYGAEHHPPFVRVFDPVSPDHDL